MTLYVKIAKINKDNGYFLNFFKACKINMEMIWKKFELGGVVGNMKNNYNK